ncbi:hypothetical protein [Actinacidiphila glaucinigra]|uniref:hypothetical protein n=1 Tax=Actinacidiphila glaucinigra TaxID=235986 RepID=UPI0035DC0B3A
MTTTSKPLASAGDGYCRQAALCLAGADLARTRLAAWFGHPSAHLAKEGAVNSLLNCMRQHPLHAASVLIVLAQLVTVVLAVVFWRSGLRAADA